MSTDYYINKIFKTECTINTIDFQGLGGTYKIIGVTEINGNEAVVIQDFDEVNKGIFVVYKSQLEDTTFV
jgi:hypothetical protein